MNTSRFVLFLAAALAASLFLNSRQCSRIAEVTERERGKDALINALKAEPAWLDKILADFSRETTDITAVREAVRREVRSALRADPAFAAWGKTPLPPALGPDRAPDAPRLLGKGGPGADPAHPSGQPDRGSAPPALDGHNQR